MIVDVEVVGSLEPGVLKVRDGFFGFLCFPCLFKRHCIISIVEQVS